VEMVGLPRVTRTSVPIWVEVTNASRVGQSARRERLETWPATARNFAPGLSFFERAVPKAFSIFNCDYGFERRHWALR
jgi:hypothetical protein